MLRHSGGSQALGAMPATVLAQLAPALAGLRLSLHMLAATVWVGGRVTVASLVPTARRLTDSGCAGMCC